MKKTAAVLSAAVMTALCTSSALAKTPSVYLNGEQMVFDVDPYIAEDRTMVPFRAVFEAAGAEVTWDDDNKTVIAVKSDDNSFTTIVLQIGGQDAFVNDVKTPLDKPAEITGDRTFVPLRFVMESLGAKVEWDNEAYSVIITTENN